ncbi:hypothetical protein NVV31_22555 [Cytobacillus firmus]|uniref:hypothetical protein n=1 Tax=Cytobacillus firmus TaxID=1399 RepID=UPI0021C9935F|nr:hypothetical protein [Cytobacillus firmus]MCU1808157.1 hypothetical protein [Cytobacillus firmus]
MREEKDSLEDPVLKKRKSAARLCSVLKKYTEVVENLYQVPSEIKLFYPYKVKSDFIKLEKHPVPKQVEAKQLIKPKQVEAKQLIKPKQVEAKQLIKPKQRETKQLSKPDKAEARQLIKPKQD